MPDRCAVGLRSICINGPLFSQKRILKASIAIHKNVLRASLNKLCVFVGCVIFTKYSQLYDYKHNVLGTDVMFCWGFFVVYM